MLFLCIMTQYFNIRSAMQKSELISLVDEMCKELSTMINIEDKATKEKVASYLKESADIILKVKDEDLSTHGFVESLFHNAYEDIAKKGLLSYAKTNSNIKKLAELHEQTLQECHDQHIDLPSLTSKFDEIQTHMSEEVKKANEIITQLSNQVKTLEEKSNLDSLTKVFNRRALSARLRQICLNEKMQKNLHMLILDIDDFKIVNDTYGHIAGDKVLIFIANILKKTLRDGDKIFRYGGEEFIILLNRIDDELCKKVSDRLLDLVRENKLIYKGESLSITLSIGTTKFADHDTPDSFIARADKALYIAKHNGKNQTYSLEA